MLLARAGKKYLEVTGATVCRAHIVVVSPVGGAAPTSVDSSGDACVLLWMTTVSNAQTTADGTFYVSPTGALPIPVRSRGPGKRSHMQCLVLTPGDTIFLRDGTYRETEIWIRDARGMGGTPGNFRQSRTITENRFYLSASWIRIQGIQFQGVGVNSNTWDAIVPKRLGTMRTASALKAAWASRFSTIRFMETAQIASL